MRESAKKPECGDEGHWKRDKWFSRRINRERSMPPSRLNQTPWRARETLGDGKMDRVCVCVCVCVCVREREYAFIQDLIRPAEREREGKCGSFVLVLWHFILNCHANKPHWAEMNYNKLNWTEKNWEIETKCIGTRGGGGGDFLPWCDREFHFLRMQIRRFDSPVESRQWHGALDTMLNFIFLFSFRFIEARS